MRKNLSLITYNIETDLYNDCRINNLLDEILLEKSDVVFLQEVATHKTRALINEKFKNNYHIILSGSYQLDNIPKISFMPSIFLLVLATVTDSTILSTIATLASIVFFPYLTLPILSKVSDFCKDANEGRIDNQGLCILLSNEKFKDAEKICSKPFNDYGYSLELSLFKWFQITFIRPGYMMVATTYNHKNMIVANIHLATGNPAKSSRTNQVRELLNNLVSYKNDIIIIGGDMNCKTIDPAYNIMSENMNNLTPTEIITYSKDNKRTSSNCENAQIDFLWTNIDFITVNRAVDKLSVIKSASQRLHNYLFADKIKQIGKDSQNSDHYGLSVEIAIN